MKLKSENTGGSMTIKNTDRGALAALAAGRTMDIMPNM